MANGVIIPGLIDVEVISNNHFSSDTFSATFALNASVLFGSGFWASELEIAVQVLFSVNATTFVSLFTGTVDTVTINVIRGLVHIMGRDLSAQLIEARIEETFSNRTSSEIASVLATRHGLTANVVRTITPVGRYYQDEHDRITLGQFSRSTTEWDLLVFLAEQEGFNVSVSGTALNFLPSNNSTLAPYLITPANCIDMRLERRLILARDIAVTVKTWNSRQNNAFAQTVIGKNNASSGRSGLNNPLQYLFVSPNLTADQALNFAQKKLESFTMHERIVEVTVPGDLCLTPIGQLILTGTDTQFDQIYDIDLIERRLSLNDGFTQRIKAKGSSPRSVSSNQNGVAGVTAS